MKPFVLLSIAVLSFAMEMGKPPEGIVLQEESGGKISGKPFSSSMLTEKAHLLFYVDPDEKELNEHVSEALKKERFERSRYASVTVTNMAATRLPNFAIAPKRKEKQEEYPDTLYVKELQSVLVKKRDLEDDSSNVLLFGLSLIHI